MFSCKWTVCIFSYNRGVLLKSLIESARAMYPEFDIVVFDDGSDDKQTLDILDQLSSSGMCTMFKSGKDKNSKHGGLYSQMNNAISYARDNGYDYAYFVQDDMQFLRRDDQLEAKLQKLFQRDDCFMCNSSFLQKILFSGLEDRLPQIEPGIFSFHGNGVADTGIIDVNKAAVVGLNFPEHSESGNGKYWYDKGFRLYWLAQPHLAWVPWPTTYRGQQKELRSDKVLLPLTAESISRLEQNNSYAFLEDYTSTEKYMIKPYWYTADPGKLNLVKIYLKYYLQQLFK